MDALVRALGDRISGDVRADAGTRAAYATDASNYRHVPRAVVLPRDAEDMAAVVAVCAEHGVPVTHRGAGTSIAGQACGAGVVVDGSRYLDRILDLDPDARTARVQPGVVLDDLRAAAAPHGLTFGPDPSTHSRCTLGGMIGNNSCGSHSVAWGTTADNVVALDILLADGTRLEVSDVDSAGPLAPGLRALVDRNLAALRTGMPRLSRRISGYALDALLPEHGGNLARALTGTEGTCATLLAATVRLVESPPVRVLAVLGFTDTFTAADAVPAILAHRPLTAESVDTALVGAYRTNRGPSPVTEALPAGGAWLYCEVGGATADEARARAEELAGAGESALIVTAPAEQRAFWRLREEGSGITTRLPDGTEAYPGWEDTAVPPEKLGDYLRAFHGLLREHGRHGVYYGHFGEGCIHVRLDFDLVSPDGVAAFRRFGTDLADLVASHGGSLSGEHGDGQARAELLPKMYPAEVIRAFGEFKALFDPENLLNPGRLVDPLPLDADLRWPSASTVDVPVAFRYPRDGGSFAAAARRCVGVGKCRNTSGGVMCPSFRATRDERHSTRGRARALVEMLHGEAVTDGWRSADVLGVLDLCLSCKACRAECPVDVDMATYKAEFLHQHYRHRPRPAAHYSMGWLPVWARAAGLAPRATNALLRRSALIKRLGGIAAERALPAFAEPFTRAFRRRAPRAGGRRVVLWPDTFTNAFDPHIGRAAVAVLEAAGYTVELPRGPVCCGLTWVSTGQLGVARRVMARTVRALAEPVAAGVPIVGLEPSCTAALRTDLPELLGGPDVEAVAGGVRTLAELLTAGDLDWLAGRLDTDAVGQVHCHQSAVLGSAADRALLDHVGVRAEFVEGCCGLAGNFGFERGHYDVSQACAEHALFPALRDAPDALVLADGFSCRTQIAQGTGRAAVHLAEVLHRALARNSAH
ncbi:FAD-binding and (Fe-S)-binding domain-containing protein [Gandjariella thermophila]|uniref:Lactate dehydrogenase n=1 Tax=Gandjariella thermophila TaxID=1931992 RepID=A0A4D4J1X3_9PSEU|nr:FAD-binding and (Fe-S)-binding domain-containing protein [Gandjariella thermophila]GDY30481.1 lactate dehydrogenase [Gandjariella thermophila]